MRKNLIFIIIALCCTSAAWGLSNLQKDGGYNAIQGFAPDRTKDQHIGHQAVVLIDASDDIAWQVHTAATGCIFANNSTNTNVGIEKPILANVSDGRIVYHKKHGAAFGNHSTAFLAFKNCSTATLERM